MDRGFRLPPIKTMFGGIDWFIAVLVVVPELEINIRALQLDRNFLEVNVLEKRWDYSLFDYCCNCSKRSYRTR